MSKVAIQKVTGSAAKAPSITSKIDKIAEKIRERAYDIFRRRNDGNSALDDWLQAERELMAWPEAELVDANGRYEISVAAAGFKPEEIEITAFPDAIVVAAESAHTHEENKGDVCFCEFTQKTFLWQFKLPASADVNGVAAQLTDGMLKITAPKAAHKEKARLAAA